MVELTVASDIDAPAETVWKTLTDLSRFWEWNPFIRSASGTPLPGAKLRVRVHPSLPVPLVFELVFEPTVISSEENHELRWRGHFIAPWLGSGDHTFTLEPAGDGRTRFVQHEVFTGFLPSLVSKLLEREVRRGFEAMNRALKARAESARPAPAAS